MNLIKNLEKNMLAKKKHITRSTELLLNALGGALCDCDGLGRLNLMLELAHVPNHYRYVFHQMFIMNNPERKPPVCVDGGGHVGAFSDIVLHCGGVVYVFEPNIHLFAFLQRKYKDNPNVFLYNKALSNRQYTTQFLIDESGILSAGNTIMECQKATQKSYEVEVISLQDFIKTDILSQHERIHFLKLDVEGAEFDIMDSLLHERLHEQIDFIACETHERFFADGDTKLQNLQNTIRNLNAQNIFLDWI